MAPGSQASLSPVPLPRVVESAVERRQAYASPGRFTGAIVASVAAHLAVIALAVFGLKFAPSLPDYDAEIPVIVVPTPAASLPAATPVTSSQEVTPSAVADVPAAVGADSAAIVADASADALRSDAVEPVADERPALSTPPPAAVAEDATAPTMPDDRAVSAEAVDPAVVESTPTSTASVAADVTASAAIDDNLFSAKAIDPEVSDHFEPAPVASSARAVATVTAAPATEIPAVTVASTGADWQSANKEAQRSAKASVNSNATPPADVLPNSAQDQAVQAVDRADAAPSTSDPATVAVNTADQSVSADSADERAVVEESRRALVDLPLTGPMFPMAPNKRFPG